MNNLIAFTLMMIIGLERFLNLHQQIIPGIHLFFTWFFGPFIVLPTMAMLIIETESRWKKFEVVFSGVLGYFFGLWLFNL